VIISSIVPFNLYNSKSRLKKRIKKVAYPFFLLIIDSDENLHMILMDNARKLDGIDGIDGNRRELDEKIYSIPFQNISYFDYYRDGFFVSSR